MRLSKSGIEKITRGILNDIDPDILKHALKLPLNKILNHFKEKYYLTFEMDGTLDFAVGKQIFGYFDLKNNTIFIDKSLIVSNRLIFLVCHEIGHFVLHRNLKMNQQVYEKFEDSEYDFISDKNILLTYKHWIEWQANQFASSLILPEETVVRRLTAIQQKLGIGKTGHIYLDNQPVNRLDFDNILTYMSGFFETTKTSIVYRLENLHLITYATSVNSFQNELRQIYFNNTTFREED